MTDANPFDAVVSADQQPENPFDAVVGTGIQPPAPANPFDDAITQGEGRRGKQKFLETLKNSTDIVPERQARAIEVAQLRGVPVGVAYQHLEDLQPKPDTPDYDSMAHKAPATAKLLGDPVKGPVAFPDAEALADIEQSLKAFTKTHRVQGPPAPLSVYEQLMGRGSLYQTPEQQQLEQANRVREAAAALAVVQAAPGQRQAAEQGAAADYADFEAQRGNLDATDPMALPKPFADARAAEEQRQVAAAEASLATAQQNAPTQSALAARLNTAIRVLGGGAASALEGLSAHADALDRYLPLGNPELDAHGRSPATNFLADLTKNFDVWFPVDKGRASDLSTRATGAVASVLPFLAGGAGVKAAGISPGWFAAIYGALQQSGNEDIAARDGGASGNVRNATLLINDLLGATEAIPIEALFATAAAGSRGIGQFLKDFASNAAIEAAQNVGQQVPSDVWARLMYDPKRDVVGNAAEALKMGGLVGGLFGAASSLLGSAAEANHQQILALGEAVGKTKLADIAPRILDEHIAQLKATGAAPEHVTASTEAVETLFQGLDPEAVQQFPKTVQALQESKATGAEVTIPTEELVRLGKLKGYQAFAADIRVGDDLTLNETTKLREEVGKYLTEQDTTESQVRQEDSPIYRGLREQLLKAGQSPEVATAQARLMDAFFTAQSERTSVPAADLARRYGLEVSNSAVDEAAGQTVLAQGALADVVTKIRGVVASAFRQGHPSPRVEIGPIAPWLLRAAKENGLELDGYSHSIDGSAVRHAFNKHGDEKTEKSRGQLAITEADFDLIPEVIHRPDAVAIGGKSRVGRQMLTYMKRMPDGTTLYVEEGLTGKKKLAMLSMRRYPGTKDTNSIGALLSNAQSDAGDDLKIITPPADVNSTPNEPPKGGSSASGTTLDQKGGSDVRGSITFSPLRDKFRITLTEKANLSTFLHEGGHFFLEVLQDLVARGEASAQQVADLKTLKRWMGAEDTKPIEREGHEKFARGFEAFLMEGKAPSLAMHAIFQKFKAWMIFVYKRLSNVRGDLNDEIRAVMDRLVASDAAIAEARTMVGWRGSPMSQEETGLTDAEYKAYVGEWTKANDAQSADADARIMLEAARELKKTWAEEKTKITKEIETELHATRGYQAWKLLEKGEGLEAYGRTTLKMDPDSIPKEWRRDTAGMTAASSDGGLPFDMVAEILGFETGEQMMQLIGGAKLAQRAVGLRVKQIMTERHGEMDAAALSQEAMKAVHNTPTMDVLLTEFRALAAKANLKIGKDTKRLLRDAALERVAKLTQRQLDPGKWRRAEVKAAEEAGKLAAKGRDMEAALAKRKQLMAAAMAKATLEAQDKIEAMKDYLATFATNRRRAALGKAGDTYLDAVDQILEGVQLKDVSLKAITARLSMDEFIKQAEAAGEPVFVSEATKALLGRKNYTELTLEELEGIHDAVKNLWTIAKEINTVRKGAEKIALDKALVDIAAETEQLLPVLKKRAHLSNVKTKMDEKMEGLSRYHAGNLKIEFVLDWLGKTAHSLVYQPISDAAFESWKLHRDLTAPLVKKLKKLSPEQRQRWNTQRQFLNYPMPLKGANIWMIALNLGNASNKEKLLAGYQWTEREVRAELDQFMTKEDWDLVQETLDTIEQMWPKMEAVVKRATGLTPPKIEATPIETPFGTYRGGYFPVVYDRAIDSHMDDKLDNSISPEEMFSKRFTAFAISNGFTKGRTGNVGKLLFSPEVVADHLGEVIHYATHYEAVKQADKIIRAPAFKALVRNHLGDAAYNQMKQWLKDVASNSTRADREIEGGSKTLRWLRRSAQITALAFNVLTVVKQPTGAATALDAIGPVSWAHGVQKAWFSPSVRENWRFAFANSKELGPLLESYDRDIAAINKAYSDKIGARTKDAFYSWAFYPISVAQSVANVAVWHGAYEQGTKQGMSDPEAFAFADKIVRTTQGSGALKDLSGLQRGGEADKLFTMFSSYFSVVYNRWSDIHVRERGNHGRKVVRYAALFLIPALLNMLADDTWDEFVHPDRAKEKDATPFLVRLGLETVSSVVATLPIAREGYSLVEGIVTDKQPRSLPAVGVFTQLYRAGSAIKGMAWDDKPLTRSKARAIVATVGIATGTPIYGVYRAVDDLFGQAMFDE